jgi:ADP-ribosylglycohydrolase
MFSDQPEEVIRRAAFSSGDSDSIACIAGAFAGAYHGIDRWPAEWVERIEYRERILAMCEGLHQRNLQQA